MFIFVVNLAAMGGRAAELEIRREEIACKPTA
jgi:hypothetical protein